MRSLAAAVTLTALLLLAQPAGASITTVFSSTVAPIPCAVQANGVRLCDETVAGNPGGSARSTVQSFDGVPIDVRVAFPPEPAAGPDGPWPLLMVFNGWAREKLPLTTVQGFLGRGYATLSITPRGFGESCGTAAARVELGSACDDGYVRLMDTRYEVRDAQELAGMLADEGRTSFTRIGATGTSYGGGLAMALAALNDRVMLPDGSLAPWLSGSGTPMRIAAATPELPWTDLFYSLMPNGRTIDYLADALYQGRTGVLKSSWENWLYDAGAAFFYAAPNVDRDADLVDWHALFNAGEPYDRVSGKPLPATEDVRDELTTHHSSYYIDPSEPPAPILISNGFTDDLFPADEAIRFYNRTRTQYPDADIALFLGSLGHQRAQNKLADRSLRSAAEAAWLDHYVQGAGDVPFHGVEALTQTCPASADSGGPFYARDWASMAPGEVTLDGPAAKTIVSTAGSTAIAAAFDPLSGGGDPCTTTPAADQAGTATYRSAPVPAGGYTLMGSPTVVADITSPGSSSQIAARLLDVDPGTNAQTLVARGLWRPDVTSAPVRQVFQLHPNGYKFAAGHIAKLELLPNDSNTAANNSYGRASDGQQNVTVQKLQLRLPVQEVPGSLGGLVHSPSEKVLPAGGRLASDYAAQYVQPKGATPVSVALVPAYEECVLETDTHGAPLAYPSCAPPRQASGALTLGTRDSNGQSAGGAGFVRFEAVMGDPATAADEADVVVVAALTDVRRRSDLTDYTGEVSEDTTIRVTDRDGANGESVTMQDISFPVAFPCSATPETTIGSSCAVATSFDAIVPGAVPEHERSVWELGSVSVYDGGPDGVASTQDNGLFERQGIFIP